MNKLFSILVVLSFMLFMALVGFLRWNIYDNGNDIDSHWVMISACLFLVFTALAAIIKVIDIKSSGKEKE